MIARIKNLVSIQFAEVYQFQRKENISKTIIKFINKIILIYIGLLILKSVFGVLKGNLGVLIDENFIVFAIFFIQIIQIGLLMKLTSKSIFMSNDMSILFNMPVKHTEVLISKIIMIIFHESHNTVLYTFVGILATTRLIDFSAQSIFTVFILINLMSMLNVILTVLFSIIILKLKMFFKEKFLITYVLSFMGFGLFAAFLTVVALNAIDLINFASNRVLMTMKFNHFVMTFSEKFIVTKAYRHIVFLEQGWLLDSLIVLVTLSFLLAIIYMIGKKYYFGLAASARLYLLKKQKKQISNMKQKKTFRSIIHKDLINIYREPGYVFQYLLLPFMMPFLIFLYNQLFTSIDTNLLGDRLIVGANIMLIILVSSISNVMSSTGFSRAGKNAYLVKVTPVPYKIEVQSKIVMNVIISTVSIIITFVIGRISGMFSTDFTMVAIIPVILVNYAHILWSFDMDISNPALSWHNEDEVMMSKNITKSILLGVLIAIIFGGYVMISLISGSVFITWFKVYLIAITLFAIRYSLLKLKYNHYINQLEI
jgi:ABC-2 type transport system permease protein